MECDRHTAMIHEANVEAARSADPGSYGIDTGISEHTIISMVLTMLMKGYNPINIIESVKNIPPLLHTTTVDELVSRMLGEMGYKLLLPDIRVAETLWDKEIHRVN